MTSERGLNMKAAADQARRKREAALKKKRAKQVKQRPWKALRDDWYTCLTHKWGLKVQLPEWTVKEEMLARKLIAEVGFNTAKFAMARFVESYDKQIPTFGYFWTARATYVGKVSGTVEKQRRRGEADSREDTKTRPVW